MLCEKCKQNQATMHYTQVINGQVTEAHLCEKCASEEKLSKNFSEFDIFNMFAPRKERSEGSLICPNCKTTLSEFRQSGIAGCSKCYEVFSSVITPMLLRTQGTTAHTKKEEIKNTESKEEKIKRLKMSLEKAVKAEEYEKAAKIRDEIKELNEEA